MSKQRLPRVKPALFESISADMTSVSFTEWIAKLGNENPQLIIAADALGKPGAVTVTAMIYHMLDSQAEADQMNKDFT